MNVVSARVAVGLSVLLLLGAVTPAAAVAETGTTAEGSTTAETDAERSVVSGVETAVDPTVARNDSGPPVETKLFLRDHPKEGLISFELVIEIDENTTNFDKVFVRTNSPFEKFSSLSVSGLAERERDGWYKWVEQNASTRTARITGTFSVPTAKDPDNNYYVDRERWAIVTPPRFHVYWHAGGWRDNDPTGRLAPGVDGYSGHRLTYLGASTETKRQIDGQNVTVSVAQPVTTISGERALNRLETAAPKIDVGGADPGVNVFISTDDIGYFGYMLGGSPDTARDDLVVRGDVFESGGTTLHHEYVHTRQSFGTTPKMNWVVEAQAAYYDRLIGLDAGEITYSQFKDDLEADVQPDAILLDPDHRELSDYNKGARVVATLDVKIRKATNGKRSFEHVWARMNAHEGQVNYTDFQQMVERVAGQSFDDWLDQYLRTDAVAPLPTSVQWFEISDEPIHGDDDGLSVGREDELRTEPFDNDTDDDRLGDGREIRGRTNATLADTDGDGLDDRLELTNATNATLADTDGDGLGDGTEFAGLTNATLSDTDGDGVDDATERVGLSNATVADTDDDGLLDGTEANGGTDVTVGDTDDDGLLDGTEANGTTNATLADTDDDEIGDAVELNATTNATVADTDDDSLLDSTETDGKTNATLADTDGDGLDDGNETDGETDPLVADTDGDGLDDGREYELGTEPTNDDSDGDGYPDGEEVAEGTDPTDGDSPTATPTDSETASATADGTAVSETADSTVTASATATTSATATGTSSTGTPGFTGLLGVLAVLIGDRTRYWPGNFGVFERTATDSTDAATELPPTSVSGPPQQRQCPFEQDDHRRRDDDR